MPSSVAIAGQDAVPSADGQASCDPSGVCSNADQGTLTDGIGSGHSIARECCVLCPPACPADQSSAYIIDPLSAIQSYVSKYPKIQVTSAPNRIFFDDAARNAKGADAALVFVNAAGKEGEDRPDGLPLDNNGEELIRRVAAENENTIVVVHAGGPLIVESWIDHVNVTAVLFAYYPGQESGNSLTPVLFGDESPSGKVSRTLILLAQAADIFRT